MFEDFMIGLFIFVGLKKIFVILGYFIRNGSVSGASGSSPDSGQNLECCVPLKFSIFWLENMSMLKSLILKLS